MNPGETDPVRGWRRRLHACPELGFEEHETSGFVAAKLEEFGLRVQRGMGGTGVVGILDRGPGRCIGFRAELDALAIEEKGRIAHRSRNAKRMHACGHDGHMAMLLGAACRLARDTTLRGRICFVFQPAEEHGQGAYAMLQGGLDRFELSSIFALHNWPTLAAGAFALRSGAMMAAEYNFEILVHGRGGHASAPHLTADPLVPAAEIISALQTIVSRRLASSKRAVLSVTEVNGDGTRNVIPGEMTLRGDFRTLAPEVQLHIESAMRAIVSGICDAHNVKGEVRVTHDFVSTVNDVSAAEAAIKAATAVVGRARVESNCDPIMASDDFGRLAERIPGAYVLIGNGGEALNVCGLHNSSYDFNDDILATGEAFWVELAHVLCG